MAQVSEVNGAGPFWWWGPAPLKDPEWRFLAQVSGVNGAGGYGGWRRWVRWMAQVRFDGGDLHR